MKWTVFACLLLFATALSAAEPVTFNARSANSGNWSDVGTWEAGRKPQAGDFVQIRSGHTVEYDVHSGDALRMLHVAGNLRFSRTKSTLLDVGLIKIEPGTTTTEDGFDCHDDAPAALPGGVKPALEIGSRESPIPAGIKATIRLRHHKGTNAETLPAIIACGGRFDVHGEPMARTWLKLAKPAGPGDTRITLESAVPDWRVGDRIIVTTGDLKGPDAGGGFRQGLGRPKKPGTEECLIKAVDGAVLTLDRALKFVHHGQGLMRCEAANLSRNVVIESAEPGGVRGHTMYHRDSIGGISYAEFRHLGKDGVLGKYPIHFHLVRDTMRGSGVIGASIWDSHNRWVTIHGTDHLIVRDCVGYQSRGHGYFLEDATEQWNLLDRNLAVQAFGSAPLPKQVLSYDPNDGAGFWWANGRNTLTRNVSCENDRYGYHFQIVKTSVFDPVMQLRGPDGKSAGQDVRAVPFLRFEDNESHGNGLFGFRFGDEVHGSVGGTPQHPFVVRNLRSWQEHYAVRPNVRCFMLDGLKVRNAAYGIYHPDYDLHVYRDIELDNVTAEPINGGHDDDSLADGDFTYERLTFRNCRLGRDPLVQLTHRAAKPGLSGHFRGIVVINSVSNDGVVNFGGGPRTNRVDNPVRYYFHDWPAAGEVTRVISERSLDIESRGDFRIIDGWTGGEARAGIAAGVVFPQLLHLSDNLPPATLITQVRTEDNRRIVSGVSHDNGEIATVSVNGQPATITARHAGVADWTITLEASNDRAYVGRSVDRAGNVEHTTHQRFESDRR
ncbi:G8 domain-containing protein [Humisphaera borealis]|nr:G8 domain-containing protein [Humisphaera borealis]